MSESDIIDLAESMDSDHQIFDPQLFTEMSALAEGANISIAEAIIVGGFTDFVDTVRSATGGATPPELHEDDCTAVLVPDSRANGEGFLAQTWDMHDTATDHVLAKNQTRRMPICTYFHHNGLSRANRNE